MSWDGFDTGGWMAAATDAMDVTCLRCSELAQRRCDVFDSKDVATQNPTSPAVTGPLTSGMRRYLGVRHWPNAIRSFSGPFNIGRPPWQIYFPGGFADANRDLRLNAKMRARQVIKNATGS